jgi:hypothetical protein
MIRPGMLALALLTGVTTHAEEWRALWNGKDLHGWESFLAKPDASWDVPGMSRDANGRYTEAIGFNRDPLHVFTVEQVDGRAAIHVSGQGFGVITTKDSFQNFHLRLQVKWGERKWGSKLHQPRDCGLLYLVHGPAGFDHGTWPRSIEFQIQEHDMGDLYALGSQITVRAVRDGRFWTYRADGEPIVFVQKLPIGNRCIKSVDAEKPHGEWNTLELVVVGGDSVHIVNGVVVMRLHQAQRLDGPEPVPLTAGAIALQTEGAEVYYRDIELRTIDAIPPAWAGP